MPDLEGIGCCDANPSGEDSNGRLFSQQTSMARLGQPDLIVLNRNLVVPTKMSVKPSGAAVLGRFKPDFTMLPKQLVLRGPHKLSAKPHALM